MGRQHRVPALAPQNPANLAPAREAAETLERLKHRHDLLEVGTFGFPLVGKGLSKCRQCRSLAVLRTEPRERIQMPEQAPNELHAPFSLTCHQRWQAQSLNRQPEGLRRGGPRPGSRDRLISQRVDTNREPGQCMIEPAQSLEQWSM